MYKPSFCAECGSQVSRAKWRLWTSRRFCDDCSGRFRKTELRGPFVIGIALLIAGFAFGRYLRPAPPPLIVQRSATSPLSDTPLEIVPSARAQSQKGTDGPPGSTLEDNDRTEIPEEVIYTCGARTKKGTPCARRVHGPVRCWQHRGMSPIMAQEKLLIKG